MFRSSLLWKFYSGYVVLVVCTTAIVGFLAAGRVEQDSLAETRRSLQAKAILLGDLAFGERAGKPGQATEKRIRQLGAETGTRLTAIREDGAVLLDSEEDPGGMENHSGRPEVVSAREHGVGEATRMSETIGERMLYVAVAVRRGGRTIGFARAALPLTVIDERIGKVTMMVFLGGVIATIAGLVLGFFFIRHLTWPLLDITRTADAIAGGDYGKEVRAGAKDEIGRLALAFNRMAERLRERMDTITKDRNQVLGILGGMVEGVVAVDSEGRVVHMNGVAGEMLNTSLEKSRGRPAREVVRVSELVEILDGASPASAESPKEINLGGKTRERIVEVRASPLRDGKGGPAGLVMVLYDISDLRRLERIRRDFVANVSHELKTPLTAIRGLVETLIDDPRMDAATHHRFLERVRDQSTRLSNLVTDLLTISRVESEEGPLEKVVLDLREIVGESARVLGPAAESKGLTVDTQFPEEPVVVSGDREALRQVVDNLLDNAIKYTPLGGRVSLRLEADAGAGVLEVEDTGSGIEPQHLERIFERFYRVDKARSRELGGTGLGLSIVKHFVQAHGGRVFVQSVPGKGSTFRVVLPFAGPA